MYADDTTLYCNLYDTDCDISGINKLYKIRSITNSFFLIYIIAYFYGLLKTILIIDYICFKNSCENHNKQRSYSTYMYGTPVHKTKDIK